MHWPRFAGCKRSIVALILSIAMTTTAFGVYSLWANDDSSGDEQGLADGTTKAEARDVSAVVGRLNQSYAIAPVISPGAYVGGSVFLDTKDPGDEQLDEPPEDVPPATDDEADRGTEIPLPPPVIIGGNRADLPDWIRENIDPLYGELPPSAQPAMPDLPPSDTASRAAAPGASDVPRDAAMQQLQVEVQRLQQEVRELKAKLGPSAH